MMKCRRSTIPVFSLILVAMLAQTAFASGGSQYVTLRKKEHYNRSLTYAILKEESVAYAGQVFELYGTVGGIIGGEDGATVMLNLPDKNAVTLDFSKKQMDVLENSTTPTLRVLVRAGEANYGNVIPLTVLAVAHDSVVAAIEKQEEAREARRRQQQQAAVSRRSTQRTASYPSRSGSLPMLPNTGDVQKMTLYYQQYLSSRTKPLFLPYLSFITGHNPKLGLDRAGLITGNLLHFADRYDVDPRLVVAMIIAESDFNPECTSRTGAMGLGQLMPGTAKSLGVNNAYDPVQNLKGSIDYLRSRLDTFGDKAAPGGTLSFEQIALAMAAYNAGAGAVKKYNGVPPFRETQAYVKRVITTYRRLCGEE